MIKYRHIPRLQKNFHKFCNFTSLAPSTFLLSTSHMLFITQAITVTLNAISITANLFSAPKTLLFISEKYFFERSSINFL